MIEPQQLMWQPQPKQALAMACPAFELLFGGAKGGGKTAWLVACWAPTLQLAHQKYLATGRKQHKCRIPIFRKNLEDSKDFIAKSYDIYPHLDPEMGVGGFHKNNKVWTFTSGATVEIHHLDGPEDHLSYNGNEFAGLGFDEVQQLSYEAYSFLVAQVRSADPEYRSMLKIRSTCNPGGHDWVKTHFHIGECKQGGKIFTERDPVTGMTTTRAFIRSYLRDNKYIDPDGSYEARLRLTMSPDEVKIFLEGDFDVVPGAFFSHLVQPSVHLLKSRPIPSSWDMIFGLDWGSTNPSCWLLAAKDPEGCIWVIDELHCPGETGTKFGEKLVERYKYQKWCSDRVWQPGDFWGVIDKQAMDDYGVGSTAADGITEKGFRLFEAKKNRLAGVNQMKERLALGRDGKPRLRIFEDRCPRIVQALKGVASGAPRDPDDYDHDSYFSHALDALRFLLMEWPVVPERIINPIDAEVAKWELMLKNRRKGLEPEDRMTGGYDQ